MEIEEAFVHFVHECGVVVEGVEVVFDSEEGAGVPEEAFEGEPDDGVATFLLGLPGTEEGGVEVVGAVEVGEEVVVFLWGADYGGAV